MAEHDVGFVPIVESLDTRRAVGCVTDRDICVRVVAQVRNPDEVALKERGAHPEASEFLALVAESAVVAPAAAASSRVRN